MTPLDAWVISRLLPGLPVNGELQAVSGAFRPIADRLAALPLEGRGIAWDAFQIGRDDRDVIVEAMDASDPHEPAPEPSEDEPGSDWPPIRLASPSDVLPFPIDVLPEAAARLVREGAESIGCPPDFLGIAVLAVASSTIGRSVSLRMMGNYFVSALLWVALVAEPSRGKTPAISTVVKALRPIEDDLADEHEHAMQEWNARPKDERGAPPKPRRIAIDDATVESTMRILSANPRGLIAHRDELSALMGGMDQYRGGKGADKAIYLKIWSGEKCTVDRVLNENDCPIRVPHPFLSILGGLTPDNLGMLAGGKSRDGFFPRWLVAYPDSLPVREEWSDRGIPDDVVNDWFRLVGRLWEREMNSVDGKPRPHVAYFTSDGKAEWARSFKLNAVEMNAPDFDPSLMEGWGKLGEYAGRLALVLACLRHADDGSLDPTAVPAVDGLIVHDAWRLVDYFKDHARRVHSTISRGSGIGGSAAVQAIVKWIRDDRRTAFTLRELKRARDWITADGLDEALAYLINRHVIRLVEALPAKPTGGRPPSPAYDVNPSLYP